MYRGFWCWDHQTNPENTRSGARNRAAAPPTLLPKDGQDTLEVALQVLCIWDSI